MIINNTELVACISPSMVKDAEHTTIRIPKDAREILGVKPGTKIRILGRSFTVAKALAADLALIVEKTDIFEDSCVFFSALHWPNEGMVNLAEPTVEENTTAAIAGQFAGSVIRVHKRDEPDVDFILCASTNTLKEASIHLSKAARDLLGVNVEDYVVVNGVRLKVRQAFINDINRLNKDLEENVMAFISGGVEGVVAFGSAPTETPKEKTKKLITADILTKELESIVGPGTVSLEVDEIKDDHGKIIYQTKVEWSDFLYGLARGYDLKTAFIESLSKLQKSMTDLVQEVNEVSQKVNAVNDSLE